MNYLTTSLRRPISVVVMAVAILLGAFVAIRAMPRDIFPSLGTPTIYVAQPFAGMDPAQMEGYLTYYYEYHFLYITGIEHVESKSIQGAAIIKLQFHPGTDMGQAMAETISYVNRSRAFMPAGTVPPFVMRFDAGSVPVGNLVFTSDTKTVGEIQDAALNLVRPLFATLQGVSAPPPFGGSARSIVVSVDPEKLRSMNLSADDVVKTIANGNLISPSGNATIGDTFPMVPVNSVVKNIKDLETIPLRPGAFPPVLIRDIATVADSSDIITSYALVNGKRTVYIPVTKRADASTLSVVALVKDNLATFQKVLPEDVKVSYEFDQSPYVVGAIHNLVFESILGALLTGLMVFLFLKDFRSAIVVVVNIPLALSVGLIGLWLTGQTINLMSLGGLALAVGILVDESTVAIENIHRHLSRGKSLAVASMQAVKETAVPRLLAMLCIVAMFTPALFMSGVTKALFVPLSLAVAFAMLGSYVLSSTIVPVLSIWMIKGKSHQESERFQKFAARYGKLSARMMHYPRMLVGAYILVITVLLLGIGSQIGIDLFPNVETRQISMRIKALPGTRVAKTEEITLSALEVIKKTLGSENVTLSLGFVGVHPPSYPINLVYLWNSGQDEASIQVEFSHGLGIEIDQVKEMLREAFKKEMPEVTFAFEPADIVGRVMSMGAANPIEIAISSPAISLSSDTATTLLTAMKEQEFLRDNYIAQTLDYPTLEISIDRERAGIMGVSAADITRSIIPEVSSSRFTTPVFWADPNSGVSYQVQVQVPQIKMSSVEELNNIPVTGNDKKNLLLRNFASVKESTAAGEYDRYNMQRTVIVRANISGISLGEAVDKVQNIIAKTQLDPKVSVKLRGQAVPLMQMLEGMKLGLLSALIMSLLLLILNFQSVKVPLIVMSGIPSVFCGVLLALILTGTTINLQSFMGAVMSIGVALANSILLISFAESERRAGLDPYSAVRSACNDRLRPIVMTTLAMVAGMLPLALGLGEGGAQSAPLGRAVIGGLLASTFTTLIFLPALYAYVLEGKVYTSPSLDPEDSESRHFLNIEHGI